MKQSLVVYPSYNNSPINTVQSNVATEINLIPSPYMKDLFDKKSSFHKKGI
jgi:hypothetical protein